MVNIVRLSDTAQRLARHSDINLTMGAYTRMGMQDLAGAVNSLPELRLGSTPTPAETAIPTQAASARPQDGDLNLVIGGQLRGRRRKAGERADLQEMASCCTH